MAVTRPDPDRAVDREAIDLHARKLVAEKAAPKAMASQATWKIATWCLEIHGGHGYMKEFGVEKLVRDAAAFLHSDGVNRTLFLKAANFMFKD